jgi:hypothetical protein
MPAEFIPDLLIDSLSSFEAGVNSGVSPLILPKNQLFKSLNMTLRGTFAKPRPAYRKILIDIISQKLIDDAVAIGPFQGGCYFNPDNGDESIRVAIAGRLLQITPNGNNASVSDLTPTPPNPSTRRQAWLWQAEYATIWNDGISPAVITDETTSVRSNYGTPVPFTTTVATAFNVPAIGANVNITFTDATNIVVGDLVTVKSVGTFQVVDISATPIIAVNNLTMAPLNFTVPVGRTLSWTHIGTQLPPGRMGVYGMGRNWICLPDAKQFVASDLVGGSSGTQAKNYRDAVFEITENLYLAGGGNFSVPGSVGDIRAMRFTATLDASLGQGPLQVFTPNTVFSCQAPVDRLTWQDITNPILTESLISNGALSQWSTINANSDLTFRSVDGIRSLILARREFATWGNVPISREVDDQLSQDSQDLLGFSSSIIFDNRLLMTSSPVLIDQGIYWRTLIPLNFDPLSNLRGKAPAIYDSIIWTGLNVFQLFVGEFENVERAFALCWNTDTEQIELYEILRTGEAISDNSGTPLNTRQIVWSGESSSLFNYQEGDKRKRQLKQLKDAEIHVRALAPNTNVWFQFWFKPDQWPCWVPWLQWSECAGKGLNQFRPRMGLGEPSPIYCDTTNDRPLREGYTFQVKWVIRGYCELVAIQVKAVTMPQSQFAKVTCCPEDFKLPQPKEHQAFVWGHEGTGDAWGSGSFAWGVS